MYQFTLPSRIDVELREMTGAEEELLTNQRLVRSGDAINQVLKNCILTLGEEKTVELSHVQDMLSGDRLALLVYLRQISLGDNVELELQCPNSGCRARTFVTVDLKELESSSYGEEREFDFKLPGSKSNVKFGYLDGHKEKRLALLKEPNITSAMLMRIITIDDKPPSKKLLAEMSMKDRSALRAEMARVDAGIKTTIECDCDQCGSLIKTRLEAEPSFLFPEAR